MNPDKSPTTTALAAAALTAALLAPGTAAAGIVFSNGGPDFSGALVSDEDMPAQGADLFAVPGNANDVPIVTRLRFWGSYRGGPLPASDDFRFTLSAHTNISQLLLDHHFAAGTVQRSVAPVGHWTHVNALGQAELVPVYAYEAPLAFALVPNLQYYASISNNTAGDAADWLWALSGSGDGASLWRHHQAWWTDQQSDFAFELLGPGGAPAPVSEPAGLWLAALAALGLASRRIRPQQLPNPSRKGHPSMKTNRLKSCFAALLAATTLAAAPTASQALPAVQRHGLELPAVQAGWVGALVLQLRDTFGLR
ncbi:MAG: hypothetical protein HY855_01915 [Burkholderiales bacterium]|nr:hypothetical protein [Burkholderiales bacterium]